VGVGLGSGSGSRIGGGGYATRGRVDGGGGGGGAFVDAESIPVDAGVIVARSALEPKQTRHDQYKQRIQPNPKRPTHLLDPWKRHPLAEPWSPH
jgi:hypothetical protein